MFSCLHLIFTKCLMHGMRTELSEQRRQAQLHILSPADTDICLSFSRHLLIKKKIIKFGSKQTLWSKWEKLWMPKKYSLVQSKEATHILKMENLIRVDLARFDMRFEGFQRYKSEFSTCNLHPLSHWKSHFQKSDRRGKKFINQSKNENIACHQIWGWNKKWVSSSLQIFAHCFFFHKVIFTSLVNGQYIKY